jgi:hypothetical protein
MVASPERRLVIGPQRPEAKRRVLPSAACRIGDHRATLASVVQVNQ